MSPEERAFAAVDSVAAAAAAAQERRRLSPWRVLTLIVAIAAAGAAIVAFRSSADRAHPPAPRLSFMPYVDVTATPQYPFEDVSSHSSNNMVLGFVVAAAAQSCTPSWGGAYSLSQAATALDLDRRIVRLTQRGGQATISFGGAANSELANGCSNVADLAAAYRAVIDRYHVAGIDLDLEGTTALSPDVVARRTQAIAQVQRAEKRAGHPIQVWLTLPADPTGLSPAAASAVTSMLAGKVQLAGVNAMTMDYSSALPAGESLPAANEATLTHVAAQVRTAYVHAGHTVSAAEAWQLIGATPMIGQNDTPAQRFGLDDARSLLHFAQQKHLRRLSMWSVNRDQPCGPNYANVAVVSPNCSGVDHSVGAFAAIFARFNAGPALHVSPGTASPTSTSIVDNPATSPYPIWNPAIPYSAGTKIVWHRNVYQAKWWTKGDTPDAPVAAASQTPWTLIGPVLPGEHPQPTPTMSAGTYPSWSATKVYRAGGRVLFRGVGYQAKWYTQGDVPGITVSDPGQTPWELITSQ
jgi:chitinase